MSELWVYHRRPSSLARYRHGGSAAFDPAVRSPLVRAVAPIGPAGRDDPKVLQFPAPAPRAKPSEKPRRGRGGKPKVTPKRD